VGQSAASQRGQTDPFAIQEVFAIERVCPYYCTRNTMRWPRCSRYRQTGARKRGSLLSPNRLSGEAITDRYERIAGSRQSEHLTLPMWPYRSLLSLLRSASISPLFKSFEILKS
jgi:hypothetical protein